MIDVMAEKMVSLNDARQLLNRNGRPIGRTTIWRWSTRGVRGVVLETVLVGGGCCTSYEAIQRFVERLTSAARGRASVESIASVERVLVAAS